MHRYPHTQCPQQPLEPAEAEEEEAEEEEVEEVEEEEVPHREEALPQHPTWGAFKASHLPSSVATTPEVTRSYANSNATKD